MNTIASNDIVDVSLNDFPLMTLNPFDDHKAQQLTRYFKRCFRHILQTYPGQQVRLPSVAELATITFSDETEVLEALSRLEKKGFLFEMESVYNSLYIMKASEDIHQEVSIVKEKLNRYKSNFKRNLQHWFKLNELSKPCFEETGG